MVNRKVIMQLFRTMSTDDSLFLRMGDYIGRTNIFIALEKDSTHNRSDVLPNYLLSKSGFTYPPTNKKCKITSFILR